jgi:hypothetical protein
MGIITYLSCQLMRDNMRMELTARYKSYRGRLLARRAGRMRSARQLIRVVRLPRKMEDGEHYSALNLRGGISF